MITNVEEQIVSIIKTNRIYPNLTPTVSDSEYVIVKSLFDKNNLSLSKLKVYSLQNNQGYHVRCYQYYGSNSQTNDLLELFTNPVVFNFSENDSSYTLGGELIDKVNINLNPKVTIAEASNLFHDYILPIGIMPIRLIIIISTDLMRN